MSRIPSRISDDLGGEAAWARFVECARSHRSADPARHRAEPHVRLAAQSLVGRCAGARTVQRVRGLFRHPKLPRKRPFRVHICTLARAYGESLRERRARRSRSAHGRPRARALRQQLAAWAPPRGARCRGAAERRMLLRRARAAAMLLAAPTERERGQYRSAGTAQRAQIARRCAASRAGCRTRSIACRGNERAAGRGSAAAVLRAARLEARGRAHQLPALFRHRLLERHSYRTAAGVFRHARAHRGDDRAGRGRRPAGRSSGRLARSAGLLQAAARAAAARADLRREDTGERRAPRRRIGPSTAPSATTSSPR